MTQSPEIAAGVNKGAEIPASSYVAASVLLGVLGGVVLTKDSIQSANVGVTWWLIWAVACGSLINFRRGLGATWLGLASLAAPVGVVGVVLYRVLVGDVVKLSGLPVTGNALAGMLPWLGVVYVLSTVTVFVAAMARDVIFALIRIVVTGGPSAVERVDKILGATIKLITTIALLVAALAL